MKNIRWPRGKLGIVLGVGAGIFALCCGCLSLAVAVGLTPSGRATSTARALTRIATQWTPTKAATATPVPSNTPQPTNTPPPPTLTATRTNIPSATPTQPTNTPRPTNTPPPTATKTKPPAPTRTPAPVIPPTQPPAAFTVINISSPIGAGANASVTIQTVAGASCFLSYTTPSGTNSTAQGLGATTADGNGVCSWTWKIGPSTNPGTGSLAITANGVTQYFQIMIQ